MGITTQGELLLQIVSDYAPYDQLPAFTEGFNDYERGSFRNPYDGLQHGRSQVAAQAWDRGANAAMRYARATRPQRRMETTMTTQTEYGFWRKPRFDITVGHRVGERRETGVDEAGGAASVRSRARKHAAGIAPGRSKGESIGRAEPGLTLRRSPGGGPEFFRRTNLPPALPEPTLRAVAG